MVEAIGWPTHVESAASGAVVLARAWANVEGGNLDPPDDLAAITAATFGSATVFVGEGIVPTGGPLWPASSSPDRRWLVGAFGANDAAWGPPAALYVCPDPGVTRTRAAMWGAYADEPSTYWDPPDLWGSPVARNAPQSDERPRLGVVGPPYAPTPVGTHSLVLAVLTARALGDYLRDLAGHNDTPATLARRYRTEATTYAAHATAAEALLPETSRPWLALADRVLPDTPRNGVRRRPQTVAASLRRS